MLADVAPWVERIVPMLIPIVAIVGGLAVGAIAIIGSNTLKARQAELEAFLKQDMLNRGLSPEQIRQVLEARMSSSMEVLKRPRA
jgi:hypothetical protein